MGFQPYINRIDLCYCFLQNDKESYFAYRNAKCRRFPFIRKRSRSGYCDGDWTGDTQKNILTPDSQQRYEPPDGRIERIVYLHECQSERPQYCRYRYGWLATGRGGSLDCQLRSVTHLCFSRIFIYQYIGPRICGRKSVHYRYTRVSGCDGRGSGYARLRIASEVRQTYCPYS